MGADYQVEKLVLFDGVCNLCNASVQFVIRHNKKHDLKFASLQSDLGRKILAEHPESDFGNTMAFLHQHKLYLRSSAVLEVCRYLDTPYRWLVVLKIFPRPLRDLVYKLLARYRYKWFGKADACWLPSPDLAERFIG